MKTEIGKDIDKAKAILERGGLVAIPTETVYGLAANALNAAAVAQIFAAKNRPSFDPLIIHTSHLDRVENYCSRFPETLKKVAKAVWPGPLTLLLPKKELVPGIVTSGLDKVAVRVPNHALTLALLSQLDFPVAAPSANPFGYVSPTTAQHVMDQLEGKVDYILDGGPSTVGVESTIIGMENDEMVVYRKGGLELEKIQTLYSGKIRVNDHSDSNPNAPGMLKKHYSPGKSVKLFHSGVQLADLSPDSTAFLRFEKPLPGFDNQFILSASGSLEEAASRLFEGLRYLDKLAVDTIYIEFVPEKGLGLAINDRLKRTLAED